MKFESVVPTVISCATPLLVFDKSVKPFSVFEELKDPSL